jgi:TonB family protein
LLVQVLFVGVAVLEGLLYPEKLPLIGARYGLTWLPELTPPEKPLPELPRKFARVILPKLEAPQAPKLSAPSMAVLLPPKIAPAPLPAPSAVLSSSPVIPSSPCPRAIEPASVHTGLFGGSEPVTTKLVASNVQTGGFGNPQGFPGRAHGDSPGNVPKLGSFGLPEGPGNGNGTGGSRGIRGVIASASFGSGIAGPGTGREGAGKGGVVLAVGGFGGDGQRLAQPAATAKVTTGGFAREEAVAAVAERPPAPQLVEVQPVEIISKPSPLYTEEARRLAIQGEVDLSVIFEASGEMRVIGVLRSLGYGLDEAAEKAAMHIRFKPALRGGKPTDFPATLRIEFRLAEQSKISERTTCKSFA